MKSANNYRPTLPLRNGIPTLVLNYLPAGVQIFFQSENGLIGTGAIPAEGMAHPC